MEKDSLGLIETLGMVAAVEAADAGSKAANVRFRGCGSARAGLITVMFTGDVAAVRAAVTAGAAAASQVGKVVSVHVIARPDRQLHVTSNGSTSAAKKVTVSDEPVVVEETVRAEPSAEVQIASGEVIVAPSGTDVVAEPITVVEEVTVVEVPVEEEIVVVEASVTEEENGNGNPAVEEELEEAVAATPAPVTRKREKFRKPKSKRKV